MGICVVLADDHPLIRSGIRSTLEPDSSIIVVGEASNGHDTQHYCQQHQVDVLLLDISMPGPSLVSMVTWLREHCPELRILLLTAYDDDTYVRGALRAGVEGYLLKDEAPEALIEAIHTVYQGGVWFSQSIVEKMYRWRRNQPVHDELASLTKREVDVLTAIAKGSSNRRIAEDLHLAEQTVRNYASSIYDKLNLHSRAEVVVWAMQNGFANHDDRP